MSKETKQRYNHLHAEAARALTNVQIFEAAGMITRLLTTFGGKYLGGENPTSQSPRMIEQIKNSLTTLDNFMDTGGQPPIGVATIDHLGEENTQIADDQILELNVPQDNIGKQGHGTRRNSP